MPILLIKYEATKTTSHKIENFENDTIARSWSKLKDIFIRIKISN